MPWLAANPDPPFRSPAHQAPCVLSAEHSFPSRLRWKATVHKSVPQPTRPTLFRGQPGASCILSGFPRPFSAFGGAGFLACASRGGTPRLHRPVVRLSSLGCNLLGGTGFPACATRGGMPRLQRARRVVPLQPLITPTYWVPIGGTGFPAWHRLSSLCLTRGGTPRLHSPMPRMSYRRAVSARDVRTLGTEAPPG